MADRRRKLGPFVEKRSPRGENDRRTQANAIFRAAWHLMEFEKRFHPLGAESNLAREIIQTLTLLTPKYKVDLLCPTLSVPTPKPPT